MNVCGYDWAAKGPAGTLDRILLIGFGLFSCLRALGVGTIEFLPVMDMGSYRQLAVDPLSYFGAVPAHHAQRLLPSLVVWVVHQGLGISVDTGFRLLSGLGYLVANLSFFSVLRRWEASPLIALGISLLATTAAWPTVYHLRNIWQASDSWTYALIGLMALCTIRGSVGALFALALASVFVRQNLPILGGAALLHLAMMRRSLWPIAGIFLVATAFALNTIMAGGGASSVLVAHVAGDLVSLQGAVDALFDANLIFLFLPLLPLLVLPETLRAARRHWWLVVFAGATLLQSLLVAQAGGPYNTARIAMPGFWALFLLVGLGAQQRMVTVWHQMALVLIPSSLIISRILLVGTDYQVWHDRRLLPFVLLGLLVVVARRRDNWARR